MDENFNPDEVAPASYTPDEIDRKIIDLLMQNARMPVKEIAKQLYLTSPTVSARIRSSAVLSARISPECNCVTGDYSMIIEVAFKRTEELDHLINVLQKYGHTKTLIVFSTSVEHRDIPV